MKRTLLVLTLALAGSLSAHAAPINITFDGFCDGMNLTLVAPYLFGVHNLTACGSANFPVSGSKHANPPGGLPVTPVYQVDESAPPFALMYLISTKKKSCIWANYFTDGVSGFFLLNTGTCTRTAAAKVGNPGAKRSTASR